MHVRGFGAILMVASFLAMVIKSPAATIAWGPAQNISNQNDINTTGTLIGACNAGSFSTLLNTVPFVPISPNSSVGNFSLGPCDLGLVNAESSLLGAYQALLEEGAVGPTQTSSFTLTINSLSIGKNYLFQWWSNSANGSGFTTAGGSTLNADVTGAGQYQVGTFTADGQTQTITFSPVGQSTWGAVLNGFQLRQVPEPSCGVLLSFGLLLISSRKRKETS